MLGGALAFLLRQLFVPGRGVLGPTLLLLVHAFATHRCVSGEVAGGLLAAAEQLVQQSHDQLPRRFSRSSTQPNRKTTRSLAEAPGGAEPGLAWRSPSHCQEGVTRGNPPVPP